MKYSMELYRFHTCSSVLHRTEYGIREKILFCFIHFAITSCFTEQVLRINYTENFFPIPEMFRESCCIALEHACTHIETQTHEGLVSHSS